MNDGISFSLKRLRFDENYHPSENTRMTTNFANLARGAQRQQNLGNALRMINNRFNELAHWDNAGADRYAVELDIISVDMNLDAMGKNDAFPLLEMLETRIYDRKAQKYIKGLAGNNFSSYVRDYDFSVLLKDYNAHRAQFGFPENFGELHARLFKKFIGSAGYLQNFAKYPVICLSVSTSKSYHRTLNHHPILGVEYQQSELSATDQYFARMGMQVRFFMPVNSVAPLAFYFFGDLTGDYTNLELIATISTMETFQKIYRPEIYNANATAGIIYRPSLQYNDYSSTQVVYDRVERSELAIKQGKFAEENFILPCQKWLERWMAEYESVMV